MPVYDLAHRLESGSSSYIVACSLAELDESKCCQMTRIILKLTKKHLELDNKSVGVNNKFKN